MAHLIPEYTLQHIASFLPYNERIEMNRALPFQYRVVNKLNSDGHNAQYKRDIMREKLIKFDEAPFGSLLRLKYTKSMFLYLLHTKDHCLLMYPNFRNTVIQKCREFSDIENYGNLIITERHAVRSTMRVAAQLQSKLESTNFPIRKKRCIPGYVEIR